MTNASRRSVTVDDLLELRAPAGAALSPDGRLVVFVAGKGYDEKDTPSPKTIMAVPVDGGAVRPYSAGSAVDPAGRSWAPGR